MPSALRRGTSNGDGPFAGEVFFAPMWFFFFPLQVCCSSGGLFLRSNRPLSASILRTLLMQVLNFPTEIVRTAKMDDLVCSYSHNSLCPNEG